MRRRSPVGRWELIVSTGGEKLRVDEGDIGRELDRPANKSEPSRGNIPLGQPV